MFNEILTFTVNKSLSAINDSTTRLRPVAHHCIGTYDPCEGKVGRSSDLVYVHQVLGKIRGNTP